MAGLTQRPRDVRVALAAASAGPDDRPMRIAPAAPPLAMANPHTGTGILGGIAFDDPGTDGSEEAAVRAQGQLLVNGAPSDAVLAPLGADRYRLASDGWVSDVVLGPPERAADGTIAREVLVSGFRFLVTVEDEGVAALRERAARGRTAGGHVGPLSVKAIIPGKVVAVSVAPGDPVAAGQQLLVVEAMKMQNELRAPRDGTVDRVGVTVGVNIEIGDLLVVIS